MKFKLILAGVFAFLGTLSFLRIIGGEVQLQRRVLELEKRRKDDAKHKEQWALSMTMSEPITVEPQSARGS